MSIGDDSLQLFKCHSSASLWLQLKVWTGERFWFRIFDRVPTGHLIWARLYPGAISTLSMPCCLGVSARRVLGWPGHLSHFHDMYSFVSLRFLYYYWNIQIQQEQEETCAGFYVYIW